MSAGEKIELMAIADELQSAFEKSKGGGRRERLAMRCSRRIREVIGGGAGVVVASGAASSSGEVTA